jgi:hypothetical protein
MTFNVGFFVAVIAGYVLGTLLFSHVVENATELLHQRRKAAAAAQVRPRLFAPPARGPLSTCGVVRLDVEPWSRVEGRVPGQG